MMLNFYLKIIYNVLGDFMERVQKVIANLGYASRREAERLIQEGKVLINGNVANLGDKVTTSDVIKIEGVILDKTKSNDKVYYLLNKPRGVVTTSHDEKGRKTVVDLIDTDKRIYPVGRLDYDTTGALLLTNDGELTNKLIHPKNKVEKVYLAKIKGIITGTDINKMKNGLVNFYIVQLNHFLISKYIFINFKIYKFRVILFILLCYVSR